MALAALLLAPLAAQDPPAAEVPATAPAGAGAFRSLPRGHLLRLEPVPGMAEQAIAVLWPHPAEQDGDRAVPRRALAAAIASYRQQAAALGSGVPTTAEVVAEATVFSAVLPAGGVGAAAWLQALRRPVDAADDADVVRRVVARAALEADDAAWLYPGSVLATRAATALGVATADPVVGLQHLAPAAFVAALAAPTTPLVVALLGDSAGAEELATALASIPVASRAPRRGAQDADAVVPASAAGVDVDLVHPRVDAGFVAAAFRAPAPAPEQLGFAVGIAVLRARAEAAFANYRGGEPFARAPFVAYDFLAADPLVVLCRRGVTPERWPVGADRDPAPRPSSTSLPRREIEDLLAAFRAAPATAAEVAAAAQLLGAEWSVPPWSADQLAAFATAPQGLVARARALVLLRHHGIGDAAVRALPGIAVAEVVGRTAAAIAPEAVWWGGLVPVASELFGR